MNLYLTGHHLEITPSIREYVSTKLARITHHFDHVIDINVILTVEKLAQKVEASVHVRGKDIHCESTDPDMYAAIDGLVDKLDRTIIKHKEKSLGQRHDGGTSTMAGNEADDERRDDHGERPLAGARTQRTDMNLIAKLLPPSNVVLDLEVSSKKRVFEQVGLLYENNHHIARSQVFDSLFAREKLGSTGLGQGIAIPHGRIKGMKEAVGAFVRLKQPIPFDAPDGQPVNLVFVLLVPDRATDLHLQILSELAQMFSDRPFRERLLAAVTPAEVNQLVAEWQPHAASQHSPVV